MPHGLFLCISSCLSCKILLPDLNNQTVYGHIYNFELWRSFPCKSTYHRLHPLYRPTPLQLAVPHSPAIDWLPWPALRDQVIQEQNQVDVDRLCVMALEHILVEPLPATRSDRDQQQQATTTSSFRIWDMYLLEKAGGGLRRSSSSAMTCQPASPNLWALAHTYRLPFQDIGQLRIDRPFYDVFPEFYNIPGCTSGFPTTALDVEAEEQLHYPSDLNSASLYRLQKRVHAWLTVNPEAVA